jgi:hypothetical protein
MAHVEVERTIHCPPQRFLELALDVQGYARFDDRVASVQAVRRVDAELVEVVYRPRLPGLPLPEPPVVALLTVEPGRRIDVALAPPPANRLQHRMARYTASFAGEPDGDGTRARRTVSYEFARPLRWLFEPIVKRGLARSVAREMDQVKAYLEAGT